MLLFKFAFEIGIIGGEFFERFEISERFFELGGFFEPFLFEGDFLENALCLCLIAPEVLRKRQLL